MFSIFKRNYHLVDQIAGIPDFHNHTLPGIDDGADTVETSRALFHEFENIGITNIVATPHIIGEFYPNTRETISTAYQQVIESNAGPGHLKFAAEYMMDQHFVEILAKDELLPVVENKILVEMSYFQPPINLNQILFKLQNSSKVPILAHPERYTYIHSRNLEEYKNLKMRGCLMQLNMLSLTTHYGKGIQKVAFELINNGLIDYISSDVHKISHLEKIKEIKIPEKLKEKLLPICENNLNLFSDSFK